MDEPSPEERTRRARAIWAYSMLTQVELAERASIAPRTLANYLEKNKPAPPLTQLYKIADACGVPRTFMEEGFSVPVSDDDGRVLELEERLDAVGVALPLLLEPVKEHLPSAAVRAIEQALHTIVRPNRRRQA
jgi:transcriptional regulator with XRE-family HTH domain